MSPINVAAARMTTRIIGLHWAADALDTVLSPLTTTSLKLALWALSPEGLHPAFLSIADSVLRLTTDNSETGGSMTIIVGGSHASRFA
jgi:hypothetical protein